MDQYQNQKKKTKGLVVIMLIAVIALAGFSYAWFNFSKDGSTSTVITGSLYLVMNEGTDTINLTSVFPESKEEARARNDNFITFTVSGKNTSDKDINYEITLNNGSETSGKTRFNSEDLVFDLIELGDNNEETLILDAVSFDEFNNKKIWIDKVDANTTQEIEKTYKLRMWISDSVIISDSDPNRTYYATGNNAFKNHYASVKVAVDGDMKEKELPFALAYENSYIRDGQTYISNTIENANSENNQDTFELTITSSNNNVEFIYDSSDVVVSNISNENLDVRPSFLVNDDEYHVVKIASETLATFTKQYTIQNNKKVSFDVILSSKTGKEESTDLTFTLRKNNVVVQELVKHIKVLGISYGINLDIDNVIRYTGSSISVEPTITNPDGTSYNGQVDIDYYSGSTCTGTPLVSAPSSVGTYCVKVTVPADGDIKETSVEKIISITKDDTKVQIANNGGTYTGSPVEAVVTPNNATVKYYTNSTCTLGETTTPPTTVGIYYAKAVLYTNQNQIGSETECVAYTVSARTIESNEITLSSSSFTYDGTSKSPTITISDGTNTLVEGTDYDVVYSNNTNAGEGIATITLKGNYSGEINKTYTINQREVTATLPTTNSETLTYNGSAQTLFGTAGSSTIGGTMYYYTTDYTTSTAPAFATTGAGWTTEYPSNVTGTNAGTYYLWTYCYVADTTNNTNATGTSINTAVSVTKVINQNPTCQMSVSNPTTQHPGTTYDLSTLVSGAQGTVTYALAANGNNTTTASTISGSTLTIGEMSTTDDNDQTIDITITDAGSANYAGCTINKTVTVEKYTRTFDWSSSTPANNSTIYAGAYTATATATGSGGTTGSITYTSSNTSYATINSSTGVMTVVDPASRSFTVTGSLARTSTVKASSITRTFVTGEVWAEDLGYDNTNSSGINCTGNNANAQCALDAIASILGISS